MKLSHSTLVDRIEEIIVLLRQATKKMNQPAASSIVKEYGRDPYLILVSCILSLRTKDTTSLPASHNLFRQVRTPEQMIKIPLIQLEKLIYPVGFYRNKAQAIKKLSHELIERFGGEVPKTYDDLISLPGVGPKTANLVLGEAFKIPAICVDTHVHRISNRLGIVKTATPVQTEAALKKILPKKYWIEYNRLLVIWGQNVCVPVSPFCSTCVLAPLCPKVGVKRRR